MSNVVQFRRLADNQMNLLQPELISAITADQLHYQLDDQPLINIANNHITSSATNSPTSSATNPLTK
jgi:hypothetical protein